MRSLAKAGRNARRPSGRASGANFRLQLAAIRTPRNGVPERERLGRLGYIMHAMKLGPAIESSDRCRQGAWKTMRRVFATAQPADEALTGNAQEDTAAESMQQREIVEQRQIVPVVLAETDS